MYQPKDTGQPPTFKDSQGASWQIKLTGDLIDTVQAATGVDLMPDNQDYTPIINLVRSHRALGKVLWACVERAAATNGVSRDKFFESLDGTTYVRGWEALLDAIYFFIHALRPKHAEAFLAMIETTMKVNEAEAETQIALILSETTDEALRSAVQDIKGRLQDEIKKEFASSAANLPQSLASTQALTRSAN